MADNPYTPPTLSGFNANPPSDDGSQVSTNEIAWSKHLDKIGTPLKNFAEAIDSAVSSAFGETINTGANQENAMAGSLAFTSSELTIAAGTITPTRSRHTVDTQSDASTDDLDTMSTVSVSDGAIVTLVAENGGRTVVVKHEAGGAGQFHLRDGVDFSLDDIEKSLILQRRGIDWYEWPFHPPIQVVINIDSVQKTDTFTTASTSYTDVTGLSLSPTLANSANSVLLICAGVASNSVGNGTCHLQFDRGGTAIGVGAAAGSRTQATTAVTSSNGTDEYGFTMLHIDAPGSTAPTYKVQMRVDTGNGYIGRSALDTDSADLGRFSTAFYAIEIGS